MKLALLRFVAAVVVIGSVVHASTIYLLALSCSQSWMMWLCGASACVVMVGYVILDRIAVPGDEPPKVRKPIPLARGIFSW